MGEIGIYAKINITTSQFWNRISPLFVQQPCLEQGYRDFCAYRAQRLLASVQENGGRCLLAASSWADCGLWWEALLCRARSHHPAGHKKSDFSSGPSGTQEESEVLPLRGWNLQTFSALLVAGAYTRKELPVPMKLSPHMKRDHSNKHWSRSNNSCPILFLAPCPSPPLRIVEKRLGSQLWQLFCPLAYCTRQSGVLSFFIFGLMEHWQKTELVICSFYSVDETFLSYDFWSLSALLRHRAF